MESITIVEDRNGEGLAALAALQRRLSLEEGAVSEASRRRTREVFGADLTPVEVVRRVIADVKAEGDEALVRYTRLLDGVTLDAPSLVVPPEEIEAGYRRCDDALRAALEDAAARIRRYQEHVRAQEPPVFENPPVRVRTVLRPIRRAGVYAPGGAARYPSSVLMSAVPAAAAGVAEIAVTTPPGRDGPLPDAVLAACRIAGVTELYRLGGAQAIAALALGTPTVRAVDKIVGPGNMFVNLAKKELFGTVGIDLLAGPSEVLILADGSADPDRAAADLLSQAEHSPGAAVLVTDSRALAEAVAARLPALCAGMPDGDRAAYCLAQYGLLIVVPDRERAIDLANRFAPEHMQILTEDPDEILPQIRAAGAVFLGTGTPVAVGDYLAGPSHVLPTGGTARFLGGLSANDFLVQAAAIEMAGDDAALERIAVIADAEGLPAHAASARARRAASP